MSSTYLKAFSNMNYVLQGVVFQTLRVYLEVVTLIRNARKGDPRASLSFAYLLLAAAASASATFTYVAGTCWAHLDATGHAKWCI